MPRFVPAHRHKAAGGKLLADRRAVLRLLAAGPVLGAAAGDGPQTAESGHACAGS